MCLEATILKDAIESLCLLKRFLVLAVEQREHLESVHIDLVSVVALTLEFLR